jgi:type II secretory pathway pseudopilin PulG
MKHRVASRTRPDRVPHGERGLALVFCLLLLGVFALLGVPTLSAAIVELRLAQNADLQLRAFRAAEHALDVAMRTADLTVADTYTTPRRVPESGALPAPGVPGDSYSFRLYFAQSTPVALSDPTAALADSLEFHFVVEATGHAVRGATDTHVQGFKIVRATGWTADAPAPNCRSDPECVAPAAPVRTFWYAPGSE